MVFHVGFFAGNEEQNDGIQFRENGYQKQDQKKQKLRALNFDFEDFLELGFALKCRELFFFIWTWFLFDFYCWMICGIVLKIQRIQRGKRDIFGLGCKGIKEGFLFVILDFSFGEEMGYFGGCFQQVLGVKGRWVQVRVCSQKVV